MRNFRAPPPQSPDRTQPAEAPGSAWDFPLPPRSPPMARPLQEEIPFVMSPPVDDRLPRFGLAGMASPDDWSEFRGGERKLTELPRLSIPSGEAWDRNMILNTWVKEVVLAATTVSIAFSDFVSSMLEKARARYVYQKAHPREKVAPRELPPELSGATTASCVCLSYLQFP